MQIKTILYPDSVRKLPASGQHIVAYQEADEMVVYQAYNAQIAAFAVKNQALGGPHFSYSRMSWIKPNFLWMMFRCGWASKENQEHVLAIWLAKKDFEIILSQAVFSSFKQEYYSDTDNWKKELETKEVRLQWDPDHDPHGNKLARRAVQLGLKDEVLKQFGQLYIRRIEDITDFVQEQGKMVAEQNTGLLQVPDESVYTCTDESLYRKFGIDR